MVSLRESSEDIVSTMGSHSCLMRGCEIVWSERIVRSERRGRIEKPLFGTWNSEVQRKIWRFFATQTLITGILVLRGLNCLQPSPGKEEGGHPSVRWHRAEHSLWAMWTSLWLKHGCWTVTTSPLGPLRRQEHSKSLLRDECDWWWATEWFQKLVIYIYSRVSHLAYGWTTEKSIDSLIQTKHG